MGNEDVLNLQIEISKTLAADIERIGKKEERKRNGQIIWFLKEAVKKYDKSQLPDK